LGAVADWYEARHPAGADRFFADFEKLVEHLGRTPSIGRRRDDLEAGLRQYPVYPFTVYYEVDETTRIVRILSVVHASRNVVYLGSDDDDEDG
jgi:plasmid stabilization system protein ParE